MRRSATISVTVLFLAILASWWYFDWGHKSVEKLPWLHGQSLAAVIAELGKPDSDFEYTMGTSPDGEFRVELYNTYPPHDPKTAHARIKELQWHRARYHVAVWMHQVNGQWVVLDTCRWKEGVVF
ncbi:hypothetical protein AYO40_00450 [Planctomycetaceae bacterium SCGC AG-212-D15]|nr:hypothetical protein AYO40_00450 [Planctomycetaceae bacterium SCGC AG-212-D15]